MTPRTIGVLGGMGPAATVDFFRRLVQATPATRDQDHVHVLIDNDPSVPDRSCAIAGVGPDPLPILTAMALRLEHAGADVLVMPCNTAYSFAGAISAAVAIPLLDWPVIAIDECVAAGAERIGLLATDGTIASGVYEKALRHPGARFVRPDEATQAESMDVIYAVKASGATAEAAERLDALTERMLAEEADVVLLACTELSVLADLPSSSANRRNVMDASDIVARAAVAFARAEESSLSDAEHLFWTPRA